MQGRRRQQKQLAEQNPHLCPLSLSPHRTTPFCDRPIPSTITVPDDEFIIWLASRGFALENINEQRDDVVPPGGAVHCAAWEGSTRHLRWLASHGANLHLSSSSTGCTPFHLAMEKGFYACCVFLYKHGCAGDLAAANFKGMTPPDLARQRDQIHILRWLATLDRGESYSAEESANPAQSPAERELNPRADYWFRTAVPPPTKAELAALEKERQRATAMSLAGLDSDSFQGFTKGAKK